MGLKSLWNRWDEDQKSSAVKIAGAVIGILAIVMIAGSISYLFSWKADQSLLSDPDMMSPDAHAANGGGKFGYGFGRLLIYRMFGLGSFALPVIMIALSLRLMAGKWHYSLLKTAVVLFSGALVSSILLSFVGGLSGLGNAFGAGLGGECGNFLVMWSDNLFGHVITGLLVFVLVIIYLVLCNHDFASWLASLGRKVQKEDVELEIGDIPDFGAIIRNSATPVVPEEATDTKPVREPEVVRENMGTELTTDVEAPLPPINMRDELPWFKAPGLDLLKNHSYGKTEVSNEELTRNRNKISTVLESYHIQVAKVTAVVGPTVTLYKVYPASGVRISAIKQRQEDIAMNLNAFGVRMVTLNDSIGIEVANDRPATVPVKALLNDEAFRNTDAELPVAIGYTITQQVKVFDLADAPHLLVAGATKQGKSVGLNVIVTSLLYSKHPSELKFVFIDPKMVEFSSYSHLLKHYLAVLPNAGDEEEERSNAIVKKAPDAEKILRSLCVEMDERYELMNKGMVNNVKLYNEKYKSRHLLPTAGHRYLPYLVVVIDEYADLTMSIGGSAEVRAASKSIQNSIIRLAQKGRACGIHVILATQRPSVDVISGIIKTNFPTRIAFRVSSRVDSQTILDSPGAEKLIGKGDMLYYSGIDTDRIQCGYISGEEINEITGFIGKQSGYKKSYNTPYYLPDVVSADGEAGGAMVDMNSLDDRFEEAARLVVTTMKGSTSDLQRRLGMGYARAGKVMDQLEAAGIVGPQEGSKPRQVIVPDLESLQPILDAYLKK